MATAEELLSGTSVSGADKTLVISNDLRTIAIPSSVKCLGVEYDDDVLQLNFKMPRYIGPTDLSPFTIRINYMNAQGEGDVYTVKSPTKGDQYITFSWLVGPIATRYKGDTKFNVCLRTFTGSGEDLVVDREYNTTIASLPVLEGLEVDASFLEDHVDLLEQWRRDLFGAGDSAVNAVEEASQKEQENIAQKGIEVLATIPEDYQTTFEMIDNADRTKSDAIISTAEGEIITVADSSDDYLRGLRVFGKTTQISTTGAQLFDGAKLSDLTGNGVTMTNDGLGRISLVGTATAAVSSINIAIKDLSPGTYSVSGEIPGKIFFYIRVTLADGTFKYYKAPNVFTLDGTETQILGYLYAPQGDVSFNGDVVCPMLNKGDTALPWEPYSGGVASPSPDWPQLLTNIEHPTVELYGKNLLKLVTSTQTTNGVTFTVNDDQSVTIKGTATASVYYGLNYNVLTLIPGEQYTMTGGLAGSSGTTYRLYAQTIDGKKFYADYGNGVSFTATDEQWQVLFAVYKDTAVDFTIYPALRLKSVADATYEPYVDQSNVTLPYGLNAVPVAEGGNYTDENGQQWICDEIDFERGVYIQRVYGLVSDYATGWKISGNSTTNHNAFYRMNTDLPVMIKGTNQPVICTHFAMTGHPINDHVTCVSGGLSNQEVYYFVPKSEFPDVETWTNYVLEQANSGTPITTYYVLATPIETPLTADEIQWFKFAHTNYPNTTVLNDAGATMQLKYNVDTKTYLDNVQKPTNDQVQAAVDAWLTANYASAEGAKF